MRAAAGHSNQQLCSKHCRSERKYPGKTRNRSSRPLDDRPMSVVENTGFCHLHSALEPRNEIVTISQTLSYQNCMTLWKSTSAVCLRTFTMISGLAVSAQCLEKIQSLLRLRSEPESEPLRCFGIRCDSFWDFWPKKQKRPTSSKQWRGL